MAGILGGGNDNAFTSNHLWNLTYESTDSGAWYSGRSWVRRGNVVQGNTFVSIRNVEGMALGWPQVQVR